MYATQQRIPLCEMPVALDYSYRKQEQFIMNKNKALSSVDEYIKSQSEKTQKALLELRSCIFKAAPKAIELFNYKIPAYALIEGGKRDQQIMMAGYKKHIGFYPHPTVMEHFDKELSEYRKGKGSVQFPINKPLPKELIIKMIKYRLELLNGKSND